MFSIPNILTGFNLLSGIISILFLFSGRLEWAVLAIFIGAFFDFLDGLVARLLKKQGELGKQLDSLADMVTFGVAPGLLVFVLLILSGGLEITLSMGGGVADFWQEGTMANSVHYWINTYLNDLMNNDINQYPPLFKGWYLILPFVALFIPFMSLFRLAKFNIDTRQSDHFIGLPTPANSIFFASFALMLWDGFGTNDWRLVLSLTLIKDQVLMTFIVLFSVLLVAEMKLFSLKFKTFDFKSNRIRYLFVIGSVVLFSILFVWAIPIIIILYIITSFVMSRLENS